MGETYKWNIVFVQRDQTKSWPYIRFTMLPDQVSELALCIIKFGILNHAKGWVDVIINRFREHEKWWINLNSTCYFLGTRPIGDILKLSRGGYEKDLQLFQLKFLL